MIDPILSTRLDEVRQNLDYVVDGMALLRETLERRRSMNDSGQEERSSGLDPTGREWSALWDSVDATLTTAARIQLNRLATIRNSLVALSAERSPEADRLKVQVRDTWNDFAALRDETRSIIGECLALVGGLTIRENGLDQNFCLVADALIRRCATESGGLDWRAVTVPALEEALHQTKAQIVRLRFPEWTIWTLPLTAHEYGHVILDEHRLLRPYFEKKVADLIGAATPAEQPGPEPRDDRARDALNTAATEQARRSLGILLADIFATFTMGPAYACAALLLRFYPAPPVQEDGGVPSDLERAEVVLATLGWMNQKAALQEGALPGGALDGPYASVLASVQKYWDTMMAGAGTNAALSNDRRAELKALAEEACETFTLNLRPTASYPTSGDNGWLVAQQWAQIWTRRLDNGQDEWPEITKRHSLRDVLNAAWLYRLGKLVRGTEDMQKIVTLKREAFDVCRAIIMGPGGPSDPGGGPATARPSTLQATDRKW